MTFIVPNDKRFKLLQLFKVQKIIILAHNIRSAHNVGSILRSADAFAVSEVIVSGYTPYPWLTDDKRLPHIAAKNTRDISKTALGAEKTVSVSFSDDVADSLASLRRRGFDIVGLEQDPISHALPSYHLDNDTALVIGEERYGITDELRQACDKLVEIPMYGHKESLNVSVATAICLYQLRFG